MRAIIAVLDSFGIGAAPDAARFRDAGANTFGNITKACAEGRADNDHRAGPLNIPNLLSLGLGMAANETDLADACPAAMARSRAAMARPVKSRAARIRPRAIGR